MSTWRDAPDASGLWWVRHEDHWDVVVQVDVSPDGVWINRGGEGWCSAAEYAGAQWCRVATPDRVEALESALREVCEAVSLRMEWSVCPLCGHRPEHEGATHAAFCPVGRALAVLRGATVAGERGSR